MFALVNPSTFILARGNGGVEDKADGNGLAAPAQLQNGFRLGIVEAQSIDRCFEARMKIGADTSENEPPKH